MKAAESRKKGSLPDIAFGSSLILVSAVALIETRKLSSGTPADMGPGFVPRALCTAILASGVASVARGVIAKAAAIPPVKWRSFFLVFGSIAAFALLLPAMGLFAATLAMTVLASLAGGERRWIEMAAFSVLMAAFTIVVFVKGLGLPLPVWPAFLAK